MKTAQSAACAAAAGLLSGVGSAYWDYAIDIANKADSVARQLMKDYDETFGDSIEIFFSALVAALTSAEEL